MKLSEELIWRGFSAETTIKNPEELDTRENKQFYWGADPSADSLTIGNLAALMMCACFVRHGYKPTLLVGGATGQIGDPKENSERELKSLEEVDHNKVCLKKQIESIIKSEEIRMVDNFDWFKDINYLKFLREVGKTFSMTQLLDRQFVQNRIGEGGSGISYAEFSYTLIQGYDFLHLYREYGIDLQLCGADQYGNCTSGIHMIKRLENATADVWSTPLVIDPVSGKKFGKSEGNAVWLASEDTGSGNFTPVFDFYQFWINQPDDSVEYLLKIYTTLEKEEIDELLARHSENKEQRIAQKALAKGATEVVHGPEKTNAVISLSEKLFAKDGLKTVSSEDLANFSTILPTISKERPLIDALIELGFAESKKKAREFLNQGAITLNGEKLTETSVFAAGILKKGKNRLAIVK
ncbi:tyrosine--tRNA ligase [Candidatus Saccharibacteria bacterium]|nr:tyrosine--tRNA ligase [Candidatus Saccharibacteria bacterium]